MKKYFILNIIVDVLALALIPLNLLVLNIPEYFSILFCVFVITAIVIFVIKSNTKRVPKCIVCILAVFTMIISLLGSYCNPYWNGIRFRRNTDYYSKPFNDEITSEEAIADLEYAMKYLKKLHPALYGSVPKNISLQYETVKAELELCDGISVGELSKKIESIFSLLGDGHTYVRGNYSDRLILKYYRQWKNEGCDITAVNGISIEQLLEDNSMYYSFESKSWELEWLSDDIVTAAGLNYLNFRMEDGIEYSLTTESGEVREEKCYIGDFVTWDEYVEFNHLDDSDAENSFVTYEIDTEHSLALLTLDECDYNDEYITCVNEMFKDVQLQGIRNVVVDLRNNSGGSDRVITEFFRYFDIDNYKVMSMTWRLGIFNFSLGDGITQNQKYKDLLFDGDLYLLTSAGTFSSAMEFAEYVKDNNLGTIIGEAPGNNPNGYGEVVDFKLPNSSIFMQISTKRFYRADKSNTSELVEPDIECDRNNAMDELYGQIND